MNANALTDAQVDAIVEGMINEILEEEALAASGPVGARVVAELHRLTDQYIKTGDALVEAEVLLRSLQELFTHVPSCDVCTIARDMIATYQFVATEA